VNPPPSAAGEPPAGAQAPEQLKAIAIRHYGRWASTALLLVGVLWVGQAMVRSGFIDLAVVREFQFNDLILRGLVNTVVLSVVAQAVGVVLGVALAIGRTSENPPVKLASGLYVWFFRGTPVLVQLIFWFNLALVFKRVTIAVPFTDVTLYSARMVDFMTPFKAAVLGLALNEGAYMAEIVRAGLLSVDQGQTEAAQALGMPGGLVLRRIVLPQAMRVIIPPTGNEFISMLKTSSLASVILYEELLRRAGEIYAANLATLELLAVASIWYLVLTTVASIGQYYLERRFDRGSALVAGETPLARARRALVTRNIRAAL
jgi:polar amino acid transport system permease protein